HLTRTQNGASRSYDESIAAATLQGIINRQSPQLYLLSRTNTRPQYWLEIMSREGCWLEGRRDKPLPNLDALLRLAGQRLKGAVIWDPAVPASLKVATTVGGVEGAVVRCPEF